MRDHDPEQLFERYRSAGDAAALAELFDRTAPELLKLAHMLVRDRDLAEDLLQATFVTAIEKAQAFDGSRRIEPWLLGILAKHAAAARRKQNRYLEAERLVFQADDDPHDEAERREFAAEVERALAELPAIYRDVLEPRLKDNRRGEDIARDLGRSPGVVRMQISRGLGLLKRVLPQGFSALLLGTLWSRRSLAAARQAVLEHAAAHAPATVAVSTAKSAAVTVVAGGIVVSKLPLIGAAALLVVASAWFVLREDVETFANSNAVQLDPVPPNIAAPEAVVEPARAAVAQLEALRTRAPTDAATLLRWPTVAGTDFAQIEGRVVEADGRPVAGFEVTLLEIDFGAWQGAIDTMFQADAMPASIEVARATTRADGRFRLDGADAAAVHALGLDLGGPRSTARVVDLSLAAGTPADLGDIVLASGIGVSGRIVDEDGESIAGARVRLVPLPLPIGAFGVQHFRANDEVVRAGNADLGPLVFEPPAWVRRAWDCLPLPTVITQSDGAFSFPATQPGTISLVVDDARYVAAVKGPFPTGTAHTRDVGSIELSRGRTLTGRVVDSRGAGIADADVLVGVEPELGGIVAAKHAPRTDSDGRFTSLPLPEDGDVFVAARRHARDQWVALPLADVESVTLELPDPVALELIVLDARGNPTTPPDVHVRPAFPVRMEAPLIGAVLNARVLVETTSPGHHVVRDLLPGSYLVAVHVDGFATSMVSVDVSTDSTPVQIRLDDERKLEVTVTSAETGAALEGARVTACLHESGSAPSDAFTRQRTDANGVAALPGLPVTATIVLAVDRPGYARAEFPIAADATKYAVSLTSGGSVEGNVLVAGSAPSDAYMVCFLKNHRLSSASPRIPRTAITDGRGGFALHNVSEGAHSVEIYPRIFADEPLAMLQRLDGDIEPLFRGTIEVKPGAVARLDVNLVLRNSAGAASLRGHLRIDGEPVPGASISVNHAQGHGFQKPDANGNFAFDTIAPGNVDLQVYVTTEVQRGTSYEMICHRSFVVAAGQTERVDLDLVSTLVRVHVSRASGAPAPGASVCLSGLSDTARGFSRFGRTNADGDADLRVLGAGRFDASAEHDEFGVAFDQIDLPNARVDLTLDPGAPCSGSFTLGLGLLVDANTSCHLGFAPAAESKGLHNREIMLSGPDVRTFTVAGLSAGEYLVRFRNGETQSAAVKFTLPSAGATGIEFAFVPQK